jgi:hypothetical protein
VTPERRIARRGAAVAGAALAAIDARAARTTLIGALSSDGASLAHPATPRLSAARMAADGVRMTSS